jgi:hypothetical protein
MVPVFRKLLETGIPEPVFRPASRTSVRVMQWIYRAERPPLDLYLRSVWLTPITLRDMAAESGWSIARLSTRARELGLPARATRVSAAEESEFVALYEQGLSVRAIASRSARYSATVRASLVRSGVTIRSSEEVTRKWPINHRAFSSPLNPEAWYWLGFLATDGCVIGCQVQLNLRSSSVPTLERFRDFLGCPDKPLQAGGAGGAKGLRVYSARLARDLAEHGVVPRKTASLRVSATAAAEPAFWLGALDGDGSAGFHREAPTIQYVGTRQFMEQCADFISDVLDRRPAVHPWDRKSPILWGLAVNGDSARQVAEVLLRSHPESLEAKRLQLERMCTYESCRTRARLMRGTRACDYCRAEIRRWPSQMQSKRLFCNQAHWRLWLSNGKSGLNQPPATGYTDIPSGL